MQARRAHLAVLIVAVVAFAGCATAPPPESASSAEAPLALVVHVTGWLRDDTGGRPPNGCERSPTYAFDVDSGKLVVDPRVTTFGPHTRIVLVGNVHVSAANLRACAPGRGLMVNEPGGEEAVGSLPDALIMLSVARSGDRVAVRGVEVPFQQIVPMEIRDIGGLSGSLFFAHHGCWRVVNATILARAGPGCSSAFNGGHPDIR